jgi:hypothetical protein
MNPIDDCLIFTPPLPIADSLIWKEYHMPAIPDDTRVDERCGCVSDGYMDRRDLNSMIVHLFCCGAVELQSHEL